MENNSVKPTILIGGEGGLGIAFKTMIALARAGQSDKIEVYQKEALSGSYDNLLQVTKNYVDIKTK